VYVLVFPGLGMKVLMTEVCDQDLLQSYSIRLHSTPWDNDGCFACFMHSCTVSASYSEFSFTDSKGLMIMVFSRYSLSHCQPKKKRQGIRVLNGGLEVHSLDKEREEYKQVEE